MNIADSWRLRIRTLEAAIQLCKAQWQVRFVPLGKWRQQLERSDRPARHTAQPGEETARESRRLAIHIERAAQRLPFETKCLPRAVALAAMLRARCIPYRLCIATRAARSRTGTDDLHAWISVADRIVIGELPGEWHILLEIKG
ncbi:lasso peptide biosynthesis B2 protein [Novosphingobium sp.]|uniref:lasso peptide biosynthesis B2 protein n=1 Tax=Novosphingobium sp. TaxID=1874826 RepID=UPI0027367401|nr:lasso peptide biosynthesis B2 protein [Novosphingobium sp.]MDP3907595.1 lasso peptide biosynthesis B2 protein [Novosphingobium sp.]